MGIITGILICLCSLFIYYYPPYDSMPTLNDPHCMGWGTTNGKEFPAPSTDWYNQHCHNLTFPITSDNQGHITESCACYESKHGLPIQWETPMGSLP